MSNKDDVAVLARRYYELIGPEHHKDRDCHFYVSERVSCYPDKHGNYVTLAAEHPGYIDYWYQDGFPDAESAWGYHKVKLEAAIVGAERWTKEDPWAEVES